MVEILVNEVSLPSAYHEALRKLYEQGEITDCADWNCKQKEVSMTIVINKPFKEPMISKMFIGGQRELQEYIMEIIDGIKDFEIDKGNWTYTYHNRFESQIPFIIKELQRNPSSRRAVVMVRNNDDIGSDDPACLQHIQYFIRDNKLHCKVLFRSNDASKATFMNMFAFIMLQKKIADELGVEIGSYTHRANSFHCYEKDFKMLEGYVNRIENAEDEDDITFGYDTEDGWKEYMDECIPDILRDVEVLKAR